MNDQAQFEELLSFGKSILQMVGESHRVGRENNAILRENNAILHEIRSHLTGENKPTDGFISMVGEPFDPNNLPPR